MNISDEMYIVYAPAKSVAFERPSRAQVGGGIGT
jgi:hypothetical protein